MKNSAEDIFEPEAPVVPSGWNVLPFEQAADVVSDKGRRIKQGAYLLAGKIPVIDQGQDTTGGYTDDEAMTFDGELPVILFGDHTRSLKYVDKRFAVGAEGVKILRPREGYFPKFFYYLLRSLHIPSRGYSRHFQFLKKFYLPLAPEDQQKRIVAEIEKQFSRLDEAVASLKRTKVNLKRYKATVLKAAVEGKLTEDWRKQHPDVEPASKLLERILAERRAKGRDKKRLDEPVVPAMAGLPELQPGWAYASVEQLGIIGEQAVLTGPFGTNLGREDFRESGVPVLTISCLKETGIDLAKAEYVSKEKANELDRYRLRKGDLLFSRMAAVGRAGIVGDRLRGTLFNYHIMRLRLEPAVLMAKYYLAYVRGSSQVENYIREVNHGATRDGINTEQLLNMPVALPPFAEQQGIVAEVERRLSVIDELEATVEVNLTRADRLRQAILQQAFSGNLVNTGA
ncbi:MAG: restriction endonuclease subunit S [Nitrospira sp.]|nr:restriction endonuclease subunit S [Nitrospira sp.]